MIPRLLIALTFISSSHLAQAEDWLEWRGKDGQGHAQGSGYAATWSDTENVKWSTPLPGRGWSSPLVVGDHVWLTTALEVPLDPAQEKERLKANTSDQPLTLLGEVKLQALAVDRKTGKLLHTVDLHAEKDPQWVHKLNSYASCSPAAEPGRVYCHFGTFGTFCVDTAKASVLWKNTDAELKLMHENGPGSSAILWKNLVIFHGDGSDVQFVAALDKDTGKLAWKTARSGEMDARAQLKKSYATPQVIEVKGKPVLFSQGANWLYGYEPATGKELWKVSYGGLGFSLSARAVTGHGMMFLSTGFMKPQMLAVKYQDMDPPEIAWSFTKSAPTMPSPLLVGSELYFLSDGGIFVCVDALTGKEHYRERLSESAASKKLGGTYSASPMAADGRIYIFNREGTTHVIEPGTTYKKLSDNVISAQVMATPAAVDGTIYLRTDKGLMAIGK
jgi:outer membrane protein assembly factor BamB